MTSSLSSLSRPTKLSELQAFLSLHHKPNPTLSQNFLIDANIVQKIIETASVSDDPVLEIGPGAGALTQTLLSKGSSVLAVEKDPNLSKHLERLICPENKLTILNLDILEFEFDLYFSQKSPCKVLGNLPYHITTPIVKRLLAYRSLIRSATLMIQREVAQKLTSSRIESALQLQLQLCTDIRYRFSVSHECFFPKPSVTSAVIHIDFKRKAPPDLDEAIALATVAFQNKRKQLKASLKGQYSPDKIESALQKMDLSAHCRPHELSSEQWLVFVGLLKHSI